MKYGIANKKATLLCDGWNNKKRDHLVAFVLLVEGTSYATQVHDNTSERRDGSLAFEQLRTEIDRLTITYEVNVIAVCTDSGAD